MSELAKEPDLKSGKHIVASINRLKSDTLKIRIIYGEQKYEDKRIDIGYLQ